MKPLSNRLVLDNLGSLRVTCTVCKKKLSFDDYKTHMQIEHTKVSCYIPFCNEQVDDDHAHCRKPSCLVNAKWFEYLDKKGNV